MAACTGRLKIVTFNLHGFNQGQTAIEELIRTSSPDIFLFQEHWLTPDNLNKFDLNFANYFTFGSSAMAKIVESGTIRGRPFGGVMFMINNKLRFATETIFCSERFVIVKVYNILIVNLYLPCAGTQNRLVICQDVLEDMWSWRERYSACECIIAGDLNVDLSASDNYSSFVKLFFTDRLLTRCDVLFNRTNLSTYINDSLHQHSTIDYIFTSSAGIICDFNVLDPDINFSDHLPVSAVCEFSFTTTPNDNLK
jgi:Endonuclease/Exonuclease/phosphatase family